MKGKYWKCDICGKDLPDHNTVKIKAKIFDNTPYGIDENGCPIIQGIWNRFDICGSCMRQFINFYKERGD